MLHQNSVFHTLLKLVPWGAFDRLVESHGADVRVRRLTTRHQFIAMLYGQLSGAQSLREIEAGLSSHSARVYHLGGREVSRSTLADANAKRSADVFSGLFADLLDRAGRGLRRKVGGAVHLIDSTSLRLNPRSADWAHYSAGVCGAKLHVIYDCDAACPIYAAVTPSRVNDITAAQAMPITAGATYVFDLGYYDYAWWAKLDAAGCRIVTRLKVNTPLTVRAERPVAAGSPILYDRIGHLPARLAAKRSNPFQEPVREICLRIDSGKILRIVTNDLDAAAEEITELYKRRWQIELFFRWVKQTLKIRHFLGTSENAVRIQIAVALIAFLLLRMAQALQQRIDSPLGFARAVRVTLMERRQIDRLLKPPIALPRNSRQLSLDLLET